MPAIDTFSTYATGTTSPIGSGFDVTPNDSADIAFVTRSLMVTAAGDVKVTLADDGTDIILPGLLAGAMYDIRVTRIWATDTTATGIKGLY